MARPRSGGGQEEILDKKSDLAARIKEKCGLGWRETVEVQSREEFGVLKGRVIIGMKEKALGVAKERQDR